MSQKMTECLESSHKPAMRHLAIYFKKAFVLKISIAIPR